MRDPGAVLDAAALDNLREVIGGDASDLMDLLDTFLADSPVLLQSSESGLAGEDATDLRRAAHSLKSGAADFGALALSSLCAQMERRARDGDHDGAEKAFSDIEATFADAHRELLELRQRISAEIAETKDAVALGEKT
jgi:HPt (histidine-containing phosphotransfer) domain-containing protein